jgi:hypothetical protein
MAKVSTDSKSARKPGPAIVTKATSEYLETRGMMESRLLVGLLASHTVSHCIGNELDLIHQNLQIQQPWTSKMCRYGSSKMCHDSSTRSKRTRIKARIIIVRRIYSWSGNKTLDVETSLQELVPIHSTRCCQNHHDAIGERNRDDGRCQVLWLEPLPNIPPSTLKVTEANVKRTESPGAGP